MASIGLGRAVARSDVGGGPLEGRDLCVSYHVIPIACVLFYLNSGSPPITSDVSWFLVCEAEYEPGAIVVAY